MFLKMSLEGVRSRGGDGKWQVFHTRAAAAPSVRSPKVRSRVRGTISLWVVDDDRHCVGSCCQPPNAGHLPGVLIRQRKTSTASRNLMRSGALSQCRSWSNTVVLRLLYINLAAALSTDWSRSSMYVAIPASMALP